MSGLAYGSGKIYEHVLGFSCCFRQWRAKDSHCKYLHGYALKFHFEFESEGLDERNWVVDFGSLKTLKQWLEYWFDHTTLVARDDPLISTFRELEIASMIQLRLVPNTGCEATAKFVYDYTAEWLKDNGYQQVTLRRVTVHEHGANYATYGLH